MKRSLVASIGIAAAAALTSTLGLTSASAATAAKPIPTRTVLVDAKHDVSKNYGSIGARRKAGLDMRRISARLAGDKIVLAVKVADLKPRHLREDSGRIPVSAFVYFGKNLRWQIGWGDKNPYGVPEPTSSAMRLSDEADLDEPSSMCLAEDGVSTRFRQAANYKTNVVVFTVPVECLPASAETARISAITQWLGGKPRTDFWDDTVVATRKGGYKEKVSKPFRFR
jgi:hypothetical protein